MDGSRKLRRGEKHKINAHCKNRSLKKATSLKKVPKLDKFAETPFKKEGEWNGCPIKLAGHGLAVHPLVLEHDPKKEKSALNNLPICNQPTK